MRDTKFKSMKDDMNLSTITGTPESGQEREKGGNKNFSINNMNPCSSLSQPISPSSDIAVREDR